MTAKIESEDCDREILSYAEACARYEDDEEALKNEADFLAEVASREHDSCGARGDEGEE